MTPWLAPLLCFVIAHLLLFVGAAVAWLAYRMKA
jgi:hypothetical protein